MEKAGEDTNRINVFTRTRTPKNGDPINPDTQVVIVSNNYYVFIRYC